MTSLKWFPIARFFVVATLLIGAYAHITNLIFGTDLVISHVMTPLVDSLFVFPMAAGAFSIWMARNEFDFRNRLEKGVVIFTMVYFTASLPIHMSTWFTHSTELLKAFPVWYSAVFLAYTTFLQYIWVTVRAKTERAVV